MSPRLAALFFAAAAAALSQPVAAADLEAAAAAAPRRPIPTVDVVVSLWFAAAVPCSITPNTTRAVGSLLKTVFGSESRKLHARCGHGGLTASSVVPVNATQLSAYAAVGDLQADLRDAWIREVLAESHHGALKGASVDAYPCVGPHMSKAVVDSQGRCQALVCAAGSYIEEEGDRWVCRASITTAEATLGALAVLSMLGLFVAVVASHFRSSAQRACADDVEAGTPIDRSSIKKEAASVPPVTVLVL